MPPEHPDFKFRRRSRASPAVPANAAVDRHETERQRSGRLAEERALRMLLARGLRLLARNVRYRVGELDLVLRDGVELVFVEVRWRASDAFGGAAASVTAAKRRRLCRAAELYLAANGGRPGFAACRFDVVAVGPGRIEWIRAAFGDSQHRG